MKLLDNYTMFWLIEPNWELLFKGARQKNLFLLNNFITQVNHTTSAKSATSMQSIPKLPLDSYKVAACKAMMSKSLDIWPLLTEFRGQVRVMC